VIPELEANLEENSKKYVAQQENIKDLKVLIVKFDYIFVATVSVAIALATVLSYFCIKLGFMSDM
jgi:hypothetical protein